MKNGEDSALEIRKAQFKELNMEWFDLRISSIELHNFLQ